MMSVAEFLPPLPPTRWSPALPHRASRPELAVNSSCSTPDTIRQQVIAAAQTVVVKVGTRVLTQKEGTLDYQRIEQLAEEIHGISAGGRKVVLVSSGAVGA